MATASKTRAAPKVHTPDDVAHMTDEHAPLARRPSWRSRKVWLPILGIAALLVVGYITTAQMGLG
jgi:hypothetical protein